MAQERNIIGISGIDTRELVKIIRENNDIVGKININLNESCTVNNILSIEDVTNEIKPENVSLKIDLFGRQNISNKMIINENSNLLNILVIDCGIKNSQLRSLLKHNLQLTIVNTNYKFQDEIFNKEYDGIFFISNGPVTHHFKFCCYTIKNCNE